MAAETRSTTASDVVIVLTTLPESADADAFARTLVTEGLAACVSVTGTMTSTYTWQGAVERGRERQVVVKTVAERVAAIQARLATLHPYDVPELLVLPVAGGGDAYLAWVRASTAG
jgi:periplasmic divalent cation tolerance protein